MKETFSSRLRLALKQRSMTAAELSDRTRIPKSAISQYLSGAFKPKQDRTHIIAETLRVNDAWLLGYDVPMNREREMAWEGAAKGYDPDATPADSDDAVEASQVPLLGDIACGEPIPAEEERGGYIPNGTDFEADFCLRARGNSMKNARILDGDLVFIQRCDMVDNGQIAAVLIDNEATLKRVYYYREKNMLILRADNPEFDDLVYIDSELDTIRILGRAVAFRSRIR